MLVFVGLPVVIGLGMLLSAPRARGGRSPVRQGGVRAIGTVVDNRQEPPAPPGWYLPVVEFRTATGRQVRAVGDQPARRPYRDGLAIAVVYDPRDPKRVTVGADRARLFVVGGLVSLAIGVAMAVVLLVLS